MMRKNTIIFCYLFPLGKYIFARFFFTFHFIPTLLFFPNTYIDTHIFCCLFSLLILFFICYYSLYISVTFAICLVLTMSYFEPIYLSAMYIPRNTYKYSRRLLNFIKSVYGILYPFVFKCCLSIYLSTHVRRLYNNVEVFLYLIILSIFPIH